jgi:hypothetical protein
VVIHVAGCSHRTCCEGASWPRRERASDLVDRGAEEPIGAQLGGAESCRSLLCLMLNAHPSNCDFNSATVGETEFFLIWNYFRFICSTDPGCGRRSVRLLPSCSGALACPNHQGSCQ